MGLKRAWDDALYAYQDGQPSSLSDDNPYKRSVQSHRYGRHKDPQKFKRFCPVCDKKVEILSLESA